jgi:hypothetical protein
MSSDTHEDDEEGEYVFDIFRPLPADSSSPTSAVAGSGTEWSFTGPVVPVRLRLEPEQVFEYDSDWSALHDDDLDSNDEDHPGTTYPTYLLYS